MERRYLKLASSRLFWQAGGAWLIPYLERIRNGETVTEVELIAHFIMLHGREPEIGHIL